MSIPPTIANLIQRLNQELNQIEQEVTEGLQIARLRGSIPIWQVKGEWRFYIRERPSRIKLFVLISPALSEIIEW